LARIRLAVVVRFAALGWQVARLVMTGAGGAAVRERSINSALLITPKRTPVLAAKLVVLSLAGLVFGLVAFGGSAAIVMPILSARGVAS